MTTQLEATSVTTETVVDAPPEHDERNADQEQTDQDPDLVLRHLDGPTRASLSELTAFQFRRKQVGSDAPAMSLSSRRDHSNTQVFGRAGRRFCHGNWRVGR